VVTENKVKEVVEFYLDNGEEKTLVSFDVKQDTLRRYIAEYKKSNVERWNNKALLLRLKERFTDAELRAIADSGTTTKASGKIETLNLDGDVFKLGYMACTHFGSKFFHEYHFFTALEMFEKENVDFIAHAGDVTEGMSNRDGHYLECTHLGYDAQKDYSISLMKQTNKPWKMIDGNHDRWYAKSSGAFIVKDICEALPSATFLGSDEGDIYLNKAKIRLWHGEDGSCYAISYRLQKLIESFSGGDKPAVLIAGHVHKYGKFFIRNVHALGAGCIQLQSAWMRSKRLEAHPGFGILELCISDGEVKWLKDLFVPFYN